MPFKERLAMSERTEPDKARRPEELAYALVTPYSLHKSRTGGILARLLWADVRLVAARMYAPRPESDFIERFCNAMYDPDERDIPLLYQKMLIEYAVNNFSVPNERGISNRLLLLLFRGPNAIREISDAVGPITQKVRGDDVRGTYGEYVHLTTKPWADPTLRERRNAMLARYSALQRIELPEPRPEFFEPAVLTGRSKRLTVEHLKLFRDTCHTDGGNVEWALEELQGKDVETSVVILKPESFRHRDPLPGNLIDFFARTGMSITAVRMLRMDRKRAEHFYEAKLDQFRRVLKNMISDRARALVARAHKLVSLHEETTGHTLPAETRTQSAYAMLQRCETLYGEGWRPGPSELKPTVQEALFEHLPDVAPDLEVDEAKLKELEETLKDLNAKCEFEELIRYMTRGACMALLYTGPGALGEIRKRLKELRKVYGTNVLQNRAHASDPDEDPERERVTVGFGLGEKPEEKPCDVERAIAEFFQSAGIA
jgi:nucleoside diphosphate kinase